MRARHFLGWLAAFVVGSVLFAWYNVPAIGAVCGWYSVGRRPVLTAAVAAGLSWNLLLALTATRGPIVELARLLGDVMSVPVAVPYLMVLLFPAMLGGSAAGLAAAVRGIVSGYERKNAAC